MQEASDTHPEPELDEPVGDRQEEIDDTIGDQDDTPPDDPDEYLEAEPPIDPSFFETAETAIPVRVVIKTYDDFGPERYEDALEQQNEEIKGILQSLQEQWQTLLTDLDSYWDYWSSHELTVRRLFRHLRPDDYEHGGPALHTYYELLLPPERQAAIEFGKEAARLLRESDSVELAYIESPPAPQPSDCGSKSRPYLGAAPRGLNIGDLSLSEDPSDWPRVVDMEIVYKSHPALEHVGVPDGWDSTHDYYEEGKLHSTAALGILGADGSEPPFCPGLLPTAAPLSFEPSGTLDTPTGRWVPNIASQIERVTQQMAFGDILLLELAIWGGNAGTCDDGGVPDKDNAIHSLLELEPALYDAIRKATERGVIVIEPVGNGDKSGGVEMDALHTWDLDARNENDECLVMSANGDSGAILVAACNGVKKDGEVTKLLQSNYGGRAHCFCWGASVATLNAVFLEDTYTFTRTSAAAALVAGVAALVQNAAIVKPRGRLGPEEMRNVLVNTSTVSASDFHIGGMPDLQTAIASL